MLKMQFSGRIINFKNLIFYENKGKRSQVVESGKKKDFKTD